jgi:hypothetical protein
LIAGTRKPSPQRPKITLGIPDIISKILRITTASHLGNRKCKASAESKEIGVTSNREPMQAASPPTTIGSKLYSPELGFHIPATNAPGGTELKTLKLSSDKRHKMIAIAAIAKSPEANVHALKNITIKVQNIDLL